MQPYTVVIPAYNAAKTIAETLESVFSQTAPPEDVVVVDDGSTDDTVKVATAVDARVRLVTQPNQGPGVAMTNGLRRCRTPLIASVDADDLWTPHKMERQLAYLEDHPDCAAVFARVKCFGLPSYEGKVLDGWMRTTLVLRREVFEAVGDIEDPPGRRGEMVDWIARAREAGFRLSLLSEVLARRRVAPGSLSFDRDNAKDVGYLHVARAALLRKRAAARSQGA